VALRFEQTHRAFRVELLLDALFYVEASGGAQGSRSAIQRDRLLEKLSKGGGERVGPLLSGPEKSRGRRCKGQPRSLRQARHDLRRERKSPLASTPPQGRRDQPIAYSAIARSTELAAPENASSETLCDLAASAYVYWSAGLFFGLATPLTVAFTSTFPFP
jgi:hypothetical protein